ncbi:hypothetical protein [Streptomyces sp. NPDC000410]|uniref:hypothetical protein n=1 Tax=Streptomyces sp. NPDC000410 TaxID=3154254 RepID=UPI003326E73C
MNTQSREANLAWIPESGFQLRKAGVQFDAVRIDGDDGRRLADFLHRMTGGDPGPIVTEANGARAVYFLLPPGTTAHRSWPRGVTRLNSASGCFGYVPVPALRGPTWPLAWWSPPAADDRHFVHPLLLRAAAIELLD